jgi:arylsulfatase A-like enzyme
MKPYTKIIFLLSLLLPLSPQAANKPNIILILLDDMGWRDVGFMGNTFIETPTLDKLAHEGLVLNNAYSNAPNCAPSRAAIMSGQYAPRTHVYTMIKGNMGDTRLHRVITPANKLYLEPSVITLAEMLKSAGYRTAQIGKWNLGTGEVRGPKGQGFDINIAGSRAGEARNGYFSPYGLTDLEDGPKGEYLTDRLNNEAIRVIQEKDTRPFFIYLSHFAPHFPPQAPESLIEKYKQKKLHLENSQVPADAIYAAMVERVDQGIGNIMEALKQQDKENNTLIIFTSDNGGYDKLSYMTPLRGQKSLLYEGGIRVPMLLWWQGHINAAIRDVPVMGIDIFPTLMRAAGVGNVKQPLDGADLSPLFSTTGRSTTSSAEPALKRDALFWYFPAYVVGLYDKAADTVFQQRPAAVIRKGDWKLIRYLDSSRIELYNLANDPGETRNLADQESSEVQDDLNQELARWLADMHVAEALPLNPAYDASYEMHYANSWWRKLSYKLGPLFHESDLE